MYVIRNDLRNAYLTRDGWTTIEDSDKGPVLVGLNDVLRFTEREAALNEHKLGKGCRFIYFPKRTWRDYQ